MKRCLFILMIAAMVFARDIRVDIEVPDKKIFIGDRIFITYELTGGEHYVFVLPLVRDWIRDVEILNEKTTSDIKKHQRTIRLEVEAVAFDTGFVHLPAMPVIAADSTGFGKPDTIFTPEKYIYIHSMLDSSMSPPAMIPPLPLHLMTWWELMIALLLFLTALLLLWAGVRRYNRQQVPPGEIWQSPREKALQAIVFLKEKDYPRHGEWKAFYLELTFILRDYYENIFFVHLQELSTSELLPVLKPMVNSEDYHEIVLFFQFADLIKFAKGTAGEEQCREHIDLVKKLINQGEEALHETEPMD